VAEPGVSPTLSHEEASGTRRSNSYRRASSYKRALADLLAPLDIRLNGSRPWDIRVNDERMFHRVLAQGSMGAGESYMDGWWDCEQLDEMLTRVLRSDMAEQLRSPRAMLLALSARLYNMQSARRSYVVGERHYDLGDDLYEQMLDPRMIYT